MTSQIYSSKKIIQTGFILMLLLIIIVTSVAIYDMKLLKNKIDTIVNVNNVKTTLITNMRNIARERSLSLYRMVLLRDVFEIDDEKIHMSDLAGQFMGLRDKLLALSMSNNEKKEIKDTLEQVYRSTRIQKQLLSLIGQEDYKEASNFLMHTAIPEQNRLIEMYDQLLEKQHYQSEKASQIAKADYKNSVVFQFSFSVCLLLLGILISVYVIRKNNYSEKQLHDANENLELRIHERTLSLEQMNQELEETIQTLHATQEQLIQTEKMASLGRLVAGVAHEINTPIGISLTAITHLEAEEKKMSALYAAEKISTEDFNNFLQNIRETCSLILNNINRSANLVNNFKRLAVDQSTDEFSSINLHDYINEILLGINSKLTKAQLKVENNTDKELFFYTNPGAMYQIFTNLILNSIIHGYPHKDNGKLTISGTKNDQTVELSICDDGIGIPEEDLPKIFEPFYTTRRNDGGTGLGLHLVYNLISSTLKGSINISSSKNGGCCCQIKLPITA
jgi:signal transduction histidine kinase